MAASRWNDPDNWTFADCSDNSKQPLISHLWQTWKDAADERNSFTNVTHDSGFTAGDTFPDLIGDLVNFGAETPKNAVRIETAVYPEDAIDTDSINTSGTYSGLSDTPDNLTLSELLTGPLGYASGDLLHITETDSGDQNALFRMPWFSQWFEVMDYPEYYERPISAVSPSDYFTDVSLQYVKIEVRYNFTGTTFNSCTAFLTTPAYNSTPVDIYVANDLKETAPLSTKAEVRDYAADLLAANSTTWGGSVLDQDIFARVILNEQAPPPESSYRATVENRRLRFKVKDIFRPTSPNKFTPVVKWNGFFSESDGNTYYDFGSGETDQEMQFITLSPDGSDYYYLSIFDVGSDLPDYKSFAPPTSPGTTRAATDRITLGAAAGGNIVNNAIMVAPNQSDGTAFEFYTP